MLDYLSQELDRIVELISEARYLAAHEVYIEMLSKVDLTSISIEKKMTVKNAIHSNQHIIKLLKRTSEVNQALEFHDTSDDWIYGSSMLGITTYYRKSPEDNCITIKLEGTIDDLPTIEQFAVIREIDLFQEWVPLCSQSLMVDRNGQADYLA